MVSIAVTEELPLAAEKVWETIGDFVDIRRWAPAVLSSTRVDTPEGVVRVLVMPPDGKVVKERLVETGPLMLSFTITEGSLLRDYLGAQRVVPLGPGRCRLELTCDFTPAPGVSDADAEVAQTKFYRGNLKAMKRALGLA